MDLRLYDVVLIVDPRLGDEEVAQLVSRLQDALTSLGGEVVATEHWGRRRLSFELRKQREGQYVLLQVKATPPVVREYERQLRLNEAVLRYMTTRVVERRRKGEAGGTPPGVPAGGSSEPATPTPSEVG